MSGPMLLTTNGTGSPGPFDWGFSGELGGPFGINDYNRILAEFNGPEALRNKYFWQPVAYPAATLNMGASAQAGVDENVRLVLARERDGTCLPGDPLAVSGYSQGAMVTDLLWRNEFLNGRLRHRRDDVVAIINFGDPMRCPGICHGNEYAGLPTPSTLEGVSTGGIASKADLKPGETPDFLLSCDNDGDLYGCSPVGDTPWETETGVGRDERLIFDIIQKFGITSILALAQEALTTLGMSVTSVNLSTLIEVAMTAFSGVLGTSIGIPGIPMSGAKSPDHVVAMLLALVNGGMFVLHGFGPHGDYEKYVPAMVDYLLKAC